MPRATGDAITSTPCITLPAPSGAGFLTIPAVLPEWLSVHVFIPGAGVVLRHVMVTNRDPDAARASESYPLRVDDLREASEHNAILEDAADVLEHVLTGLLLAEGPALSVSHPGYSSPSHKRLHAMREIATLAEREADLEGALTDAHWGTDGAFHLPPSTIVTQNVLSQWTAHLADEAQTESLHRAHAARERWEAGHPRDMAADWADYSGEVVR